MSDLGSNKGLGRGLDALIPQGDSFGKSTVSEVPIGLIDANPHQPRTIFDEEGLRELSISIKKHGVIQPLVVSPHKNRYELIAGERRLRAAKMAGLSIVPVIIRNAEEHQKLELALIENIHRIDLNPIDEAISYKKLIEEFNYTQEKIAESTGKSRATIANKIRLLALPGEIKKALKEGRITEGHGRALLAIDDPQKRSKLFNKIITEGLNVRSVENESKNVKNGKNREIDDGKSLMLKHLADDLAAYLGTKVIIKSNNSVGRVEILFFSQEELNRIYQKIKGMG